MWTPVDFWVRHHLFGTDPCFDCINTVTVIYDLETSPRYGARVEGLDCAYGRKLLEQYAEQAAEPLRSPNPSR